MMVMRRLMRPSMLRRRSRFSMMLRCRSRFSMMLRCRSRLGMMLGCGGRSALCGTRCRALRHQIGVRQCETQNCCGNRAKCDLFHEKLLSKGKSVMMVMVVSLVDRSINDPADQVSPSRRMMMVMRRRRRRCRMVMSRRRRRCRMMVMRRLVRTGMMRRRSRLAMMGSRLGMMRSRSRLTMGLRMMRPMLSLRTRSRKEQRSKKYGARTGNER